MIQRLLLILLAIALAGCQSETGTGGATPVRMTSASGGATPVRMTSASSNVPADIVDLVGARGAAGESQLRARGYILVRTQGPVAFWWNGRKRTCARVVTSEGHYQSIAKGIAADCGA